MNFSQALEAMKAGKVAKLNIHGKIKEFCILKDKFADLTLTRTVDTIFIKNEAGWLRCFDLKDMWIMRNDWEIEEQPQAKTYGGLGKPF